MRKKKIIKIVILLVLAVILALAAFAAVPPAKFGVRVSPADAAAVLSQEEIGPSYNKPAYGVYGESTDPPLEHMVENCAAVVQGSVLWTGWQNRYFHPFDGVVNTKAKHFGPHKVKTFTLLVTHQLVGEWSTGRVIEVACGSELADQFTPGQSFVLFLKRSNYKSNGVYDLLSTHGVAKVSEKDGLYTYSRDKDLCIYDGQNVQTLWLDLAAAAQKLGRQTQIKVN